MFRPDSAQTLAAPDVPRGNEFVARDHGVRYVCGHNMAGPGDLSGNHEPDPVKNCGQDFNVTDLESNRFLHAYPVMGKTVFRNTNRGNWFQVNR